MPGILPARYLYDNTFVRLSAHDCCHAKKISTSFSFPLASEHAECKLLLSACGCCARHRAEEGRQSKLYERKKTEATSSSNCAEYACGSAVYPRQRVPTRHVLSVAWLFIGR